MSLTGKSPADTYKDITYVDNNNSGVDSTLRQVKTGNGSSTALSVSDRALKVKSETNNTTAFDVQNTSGSSRLVVDTTNDQVKALGHHINTQYAYFGIGESTFVNVSEGTHICIPFQGFAHTSSTADNFELGTGTDPATTFTTGETVTGGTSAATGIVESISGIKSATFTSTTQASPGVITSSAHGLKDGQQIAFSGSLQVDSSTVTSATYTVRNVSTNTLEYLCTQSIKTTSISLSNPSIIPNS